jgi:hypothetical protein
MSMAALPRPPWRWRQVFEKIVAAAVGFGKNHRGSGSIFFEDIEKLHEFGRILVFTNETP